MSDWADGGAKGLTSASERNAGLLPAGEGDAAFADLC
jgi:hypothetical protein